MEKLLLTKSSKGVKRHRALSTALNASVSQALFTRKRPVSPRQHTAKARHPRTKLRVRSPIAGQVVLRAIDPGEVAVAGATLFTVAGLDTVKLTVNVPVAEIGPIHAGQAVRVTVDAYAARTFEGVITHIADRTEFTPKNVQTADERARMVVAVEVTLPNADGALRAGMAGEATW